MLLKRFKLTFKTTSHNSRCLRKTLSSASVIFGCFSEICDSRAGELSKTSAILLKGAKSNTDESIYKQNIILVNVLLGNQMRL